MFEGWSFEKAFDLAADAGYDGVEIAPFTFGRLVTDVPADERARLCGLAEERGLEIVGLHWLLAKTEGFYLNHPDSEIRGKTVEYVKDLARCCADLGGRIMVFGSPKQRNVLPGLSFDEAWNLTREAFSQTLPTLEEVGVTLCMEPLGPGETDFINTASQAMRLVDEIAHPNFKMIVDVKAMSTETGPISKIIESAAGYFKHFHANDANLRGPGFGDTDFKPIAEALRKVGYNGYVSVEVFDFSPDPETIARKSIKYLRDIFGGG